jgi:P-type Cu+ transporter
MGPGTDAATEASDLTLVRGDLLAVPDTILLSRRTLATIKGPCARCPSPGSTAAAR